MTEYERVKKEAEQALEDVWHNYYNLDFFQEAVKRILSLVEIKADNQDLNESSHFIWPQTTQSKEEMHRYQTGEINKEEHERQRRQIFDEELAIYQKAQQDMLKPDSEGKHWVRVIPKPRK